MELPGDDARKCLNCGAVATKVCAGCTREMFTAWYCSRKCQKKHWREHRLVCDSSEITVNVFKSSGECKVCTKLKLGDDVRVLLQHVWNWMTDSHENKEELEVTLTFDGKCMCVV